MPILNFSTPDVLVQYNLAQTFRISRTSHWTLISSQRYVYDIWDDDACANTQVVDSRKKDYRNI